MVKISRLVKIFETSGFYSKYLDFGQNFRKSRFWSKFLKKSWLKSKFSKCLDLCQKVGKIASLVKIFENLDFGEDFQNISIIVKLSENPDLGRNFPKNSDFGEDFKIPRFWSKFSKISILDQIFEK